MDVGGKDQGREPGGVGAGWQVSHLVSGEPQLSHRSTHQGQQGHGPEEKTQFCLMRDTGQKFRGNFQKSFNYAQKMGRSEGMKCTNKVVFVSLENKPPREVLSKSTGQQMHRW